MINNTFNFCPECGSKNIKTYNNGRKWQCPECDFELYNNIASAVGVVIQNAKGEILLEKRAKEPKKGAYVFPGGFTDAGETAEAAAKRECMEECGIKICNLKYLCSFPNTYLYKNVEYKTCDIFFTAEIDGSYELKAEESEVSGFIWQQITEENIDSLNLAFDSTVAAMKQFLKNRPDTCDEEDFFDVFGADSELMEEDDVEDSADSSIEDYDNAPELSEEEKSLLDESAWL